jgi:hypothetical protein
MWIAALVAAGVVAAMALAIRVWGYFEGETPVLDAIDEWQLSRADIEILDRLSLENPRRADVVVSLSTIPSRIALMEPVIKSLLRQTVAPASIVINVPHNSLRENRGYDIPSFLAKLRTVTIMRCDDVGPATKLLPTLRREPLDRLIIVVDDDRIYPPRLVEELITAAQFDPESAFCMSGWIAPKDMTDKPTTIWSNFWLTPPTQLRGRRLAAPTPIDVLMGYAGYIVRPKFFDAAIHDFGGAPKEAFFVDDLWISAHCRARRFALPTRRFNYHPRLRKRLYDQTALAGINRGPGGNERRNNTIVLRHFRRLWLNGRHGTAASDQA